MYEQFGALEFSTDDGFYHTNNSGHLYFFDYETKKDVLTCSKVNCRMEAAANYGIINTGGGDTDIFIYPGYQFKIADALITNFHLPESTLLMLVSALEGQSEIMEAYNEAVSLKYRFFSFGDAMFMETRRLVYNMDGTYNGK